MWFLLLFFSITLSSAVSILQKIILKDKKVDSTALAAFYQIITGIILFVYALAVGLSWDGILDKPLNIIFMAILYGVGDVLMFRILQKIDVSDFTVIFQSFAFFAVIFSSLFLGETLSPSQFFGFIVLLLGIIVTLYEHKIIIHKYQFLALISAAILSLAFINDVYIIKSASLPTYLSIAFITPGLITLIFYPRALKNTSVIFNKQHLLKVFLLSFFAFFTSILFFISYKFISNAAQVSSLSRISTVIIVLFGVFFLGEKKRKIQKIIGSIVALVGVFFLI